MRTWLVVLPLLFSAGCYKTNLKNFAAEGGPGREVRVWSHSVIAGLIPLSEVDVRSACGEKGAWSVSTRQNVWNLLLTGITGAIYTPTTALITCRQ